MSYAEWAYERNGYDGNFAERAVIDFFSKLYTGDMIGSAG